MKDTNIIIGIGANLKTSAGLHPITNCTNAINYIDRHHFKILKRSSWYLSDPIPKSNQPKYFNCVVKAVVNIDHRKVLKTLNQVEKKFGRIRYKRNISRCIDLDLIDYSGRVKKCLKLITPHPRAHLRKFVLLPILEIDPFWVHPIFKKNIRFLIQNINNQLIRRILKKDIDFII